WRIPIVNYRRLSQSDRVDCNRVKPQREDIKCLPTEREEPPPHGMQLKRRSRRQPRSQRNSLRSVRLSRMPRSLSLCELTGTSLITFKKPASDQFSAKGPSAPIYHLPSPGVPAGPHFPRMGQIQMPVTAASAPVSRSFNAR